MTSIGTGYDLYASQFSPDGRVFQIEYADKAVENSGTAVGKFVGKNRIQLKVLQVLILFTNGLVCRETKSKK